MLWFLPALVCLFALRPLPALAKGQPDYQHAREWRHLVTVWQVLLDHSSGTVYSPDRFKELDSELERAQDGLHSLATKGLLTREVAEGLQWLLSSRSAYVKTRGYGTPRMGKLDDLESAEAASQWVVEMQLELLRQQRRGGPTDAKLAEAIRANLTRELTFQRRLAVVREDLDKGEKALPKENGRNTDVHAKFAVEATQRRQALLEAYQQRTLPRDRVVQVLLPYVVELTETQPEHTAEPS